MTQPRYPSLYQVNTRVWLTEISDGLGRKATLDDITDQQLDELAEMGFDWIWFLSVWTTGEQGQKISRENPEWRRDFENTLPDLKEEDIVGSGFAITSYHVHPDLGGDEALQRMRGRLSQRGLKLMLDFVPNHMGPGHHWVDEHPEYFVAGTKEDLKNYPHNFRAVRSNNEDKVFAFGRDPYFSGWPDTIQLDYSNPETVKAMTNELLRISGQCDGLRCDMAMLVLPEVFERTWGRKAQPFWSQAIKAVHERVPDFCFMAEVYWEMEWALQQEGFNYAYDKRLYDRLVEGHAKAVREHFFAWLDYQDKLARFLENHDEPRAANTFPTEMHKAAAMISFFSPGLRFFHQGQFEGRKKRISPHLVRAPREPINEELKKFYSDLLGLLMDPLFRNGQWHLLEPVSAWEGNGSSESFIAFAWKGEDANAAWVVVNYAPHDGQCYLRLPFPELQGAQWQLRDRCSDAVFERDGNDMYTKGFYLAMRPWQYHVFDLKKIIINRVGDPPAIND